MSRPIRIRLFGTMIALLAFGVAARAGEKALDVALKSFKFKVDAAVESLFGHNEDEGKLFFYTNGTAEAKIMIPADGEYEITVKASCTKALNEFAKFKLSVDGELVGKETALTDEAEKSYTLKAKLKKGERTLSIAFTNDVYKENEYDRNLFVHGVSVKKQ